MNRLKITQNCQRDNGSKSLLSVTAYISSCNINPHSSVSLLHFSASHAYPSFSIHFSFTKIVVLISGQKDNEQLNLSLALKNSIDSKLNTLNQSIVSGDAAVKESIDAKFNTLKPSTS
jgi:hypothetical protein